MDEETRFSSVFRGVDDSGYDEKENLLDSRNIETFGGVSDSFISKSVTAFKSGKSNDGADMPSSSSSMVICNNVVSFLRSLTKCVKFSL